MEDAQGLNDQNPHGQKYHDHRQHQLLATDAGAARNARQANLALRLDEGQVQQQQGFGEKQHKQYAQPGRLHPRRVLMKRTPINRSQRSVWSRT